MDAKAIHERLVAAFGDRVTGVNLEAASPFAVVTTDALVDVATLCRNERDLSFDNLMCLSAVDYPKETPPRMEVVYHLLSYTHAHTFALKVHLPREEPRAPTVEGVWAVANWHEREAYDMFGIAFTGHTDLRRILLPDDWIGHPLRKDWQDPDFYNGLHVKPTAQMAERFMAGEKIGVGPFDFTPVNNHLPE